MSTDFEDLANLVTPKLEIIEKLNNFVSSHAYLQETYTNVDLSNAGYVKYIVGQSAWYFHPDIIQILKPYNLSRYAMLVNMRMKRDESTESTISNFIFTQDKKANRKGRGIDDNVFDRFDTFVCTLDGCGGFRKNGSIIGPRAMTQLKRNTNKRFLQILMHGSYNPDTKLTCAWTGDVVEGLLTVDDDQCIEKLIDIFDIHHCHYKNSTSIDKTNGPSSYLNKQFHAEFDHNIVIEFLGCILLSGSSHDRIHKSQRQDDITGWIKKFNRGELSYIPYHWICEENYNKTIQTLSLITRLDIDSAPTYSEFVSGNTLAVNGSASYTPDIKKLPETTADLLFGFNDELIADEQDQCLFA